MVAFAIPPSACRKPGPDTTRHTPGLQGRGAKEKKKKKKMEREGKLTQGTLNKSPTKISEMLKYKMLKFYSRHQNAQMARICMKD